MFSESITGYVLSCIYNAVKNCFFASLLTKLAKRLKEDFQSSRLLRIISAFVSFIQKRYEVSFLKKFVNSKDHVHEIYKKSLLCSLVCFIFSFIMKACAKVYGFVEKLASGGITHSVCSYFANKKILSFNSVFALFIALMMVCPHDYWNNLYAVIFAFGMGIWFLIRVNNKKEKADFSNINFGLIIFILFASIISVCSYARNDALRIMLFVISSVIFSLLIGNAVNTKEKLFYMLKIVSIGLAITSVIGIIQRFMGIEVSTEFVDVANNSGMPGRIFSTFDNPNNFAELLVLFIPITTALVLVLKNKREKVFFSICLVIDIIAIAMTYSRACWIALVISIAVMLLIYDWKVMVPIAVLGIMAVPFLPESILNRILTIGSMNDSSNAYRVYIWSGAGKVIKKFFLSGIGAGPDNFMVFYQPVAHWRAILAPHSHMIYLELIIEFGIVATIGFFGYFISVMKKGFALCNKTCKSIKAVLAACLGSMVGILFVCLAEYVWFYPRDMFMFWIVLGIIVAAVNIIRKQNKI